MRAALSALATACAVALPPAALAEPADPLAQWLASRGHAGDVGPAAWPPTRRDPMGDLVVAAMNFVGVPYRLGGNDAATGFDCSGFTRHLFQLNLGFALPRRSHEQAAASNLVEVDRRELQPGDLVFFNTLRRAFSHVGIYVGEGRFIHSPRAGAAVRLEDMQTRYWQHRFDGARRVAAAKPPPPAAALPAQPHDPPDLFGARH